MSGVDLSREGSNYDAAHGRRPSAKPLRRLRQWFSWRLVHLVALVVPVLYRAYCWFVWRTSEVVDEANPRIQECIRRHGRFVGLLWHQEVVTVAWAYGSNRPHTLASAGNFGQIITHMLEACGYVVFRGGSSAGSARKRRVLPIMIKHMREHAEHVAYGITVDGSNGPAFRMKPGGTAIARSCRTPVFLARTWYSRRILLGTWDRTGVPLPWNRIRMRIVGPYWIAPDSDAKELAAFTAHVESELLELAALSVRDADGPAAGNGAQPGYPEGWSPRWPAAWDQAPAAALGVALGPYDLRPHTQGPPWASTPGPQVRSSTLVREAAEAKDEGGEDE